jgi:hypothetical protein
MENETELTIPKLTLLFDFVLNVRLNNRTAKVVFAVLASLSIMSFSYFAVNIFNKETIIEVVRHSLLAVATLTGAIFSFMAITFSWRRLWWCKGLVASFATLPIIIFFDPVNPIFSLLLTAIIFFVLRSLFSLSKNLARKELIKISKFFYHYKFLEDGIAYSVITIAPIYDENYTLADERKEKKHFLTYDMVKKIYSYQRFLYLSFVDESAVLKYRVIEVDKNVNLTEFQEWLIEKGVDVERVKK